MSVTNSALYSRLGSSTSNPSRTWRLPSGCRSPFRVLLVVASFVIAVMLFFPPPPPDEWEYPLIHGPSSRLKSPDKLHKGLWNSRADEVKAAFSHAYSGYERFAFPRDELRPLTNASVNGFNGWGVTALDSLDTMIFMNLDDEYNRAIVHLKALNMTDHFQPVPFFEAVIRYLGGLLSAWHLTGDPLLLRKADELGIALLQGFKTRSGLPTYSVVPATGKFGYPWQGADSFNLAEIASCQLEYKYLAHATGRPEYYHAAEGVMTILRENLHPETQLWPQMFREINGNITLGPLRSGVGAGADSAYEYTLKQYLLSGRTERKMLKLYLKTINGVISNLIYVSPSRSLLYATDVGFWTDHNQSPPKLIPEPSHGAEHLGCFLPGLLALGSHSLVNELSPDERALHLGIAKGLATTCYILYAETLSGLGPESVRFPGHGAKKWVDAHSEWRDGISYKQHKVSPGWDVNVAKQTKADAREYTHVDSRWLSRPETIESLFILWRVTGESIWRERGYELFRAIEKWSKGTVGYASVEHVDTEPKQMDEMPSYFLAETLKYLYLLFREDNCGISLDGFVLNTEAHPLPIFKWDEKERGAYGITGRL